MKQLIGERQMQEALVSYTRFTGDGTPSITAAGPGQPEQLNGFRYDPTQVLLRNGRASPHAMDLDVNGFCLCTQRTAVKDFLNADQLREVYAREAEEFVKYFVGADFTYAFDPVIRSSRAIASDPDGIRPVVRHVHVDFTANSLRETINNLFQGRMNHALGRRHAIYQIWRPICASVRVDPLAFIDARTVSPDDLVLLERIYPNWRGELCLAKSSSLHEWYWFPDMDVDEIILFKGHDSASDIGAQGALHAAATLMDPGKSMAAPRQSAEIRVVALFS